MLFRYGRDPTKMDSKEIPSLSLKMEHKNSECCLELEMSTSPKNRSEKQVPEQDTLGGTIRYIPENRLFIHK